MIEKYYYQIPKNKFSQFKQYGEISFECLDKQSVAEIFKSFNNNQLKDLKKHLNTIVDKNCNTDFLNKNFLNATKVLMFPKSSIKTISKQNPNSNIIEFSTETLCFLFKEERLLETNNSFKQVSITERDDETKESDTLSIIWENNESLIIIIIDYNNMLPDSIIEKPPLKKRLDVLSFKNIYLKDFEKVEKIALKESLTKNSLKTKEILIKHLDDFMMGRIAGLDSMISCLDLTKNSIHIDDLEKYLQNKESS